jgi:hypothetical protein
VIRYFKPPSSRAKFERNLFFLAEAMRAGRLHFRSGLTHTVDGIRRVRYLPNRRIDLLTVDETTRLTANMIADSFPGNTAASGEGGDTMVALDENGMPHGDIDEPFDL